MEHTVETGKILAMDTSTKTLACAIVEKGQVIQASHSAAERNHALKLIPIVQELLALENIASKDLDGIAVGIGPGSYTGVRVGVTAAKTLAWTVDKPVAAVSSLYALALTGAAQAESVIQDLPEHAKLIVYPMMDARRGQVYTGSFAGGREKLLRLIRHQDELAALEEGLIRQREDEIILFEKIVMQAADQLQAESDVHILFAGETSPQQEAIEALQAAHADRVHLMPCEIHAGWIGRAGELLLRQGKTTPAHQLEPNYAQLTEAETKLKAREQQAASEPS